MYFPRHLKSPPLLQCSHHIPVRRHRGDLCAKTCWGWHKGNSFSPQSPPHILDIAPWDTSTAFWIPEPSSCPSPDSAGGSGVRKGWSCPSFSLGLCIRFAAAVTAHTALRISELALGLTRKHGRLAKLCLLSPHRTGQTWNPIHKALAG